MTTRLTRCETEVMDVVWRKGRVTVQDVCDALERSLSYSTVMTTLRTLHSKRKVVSRTKVSRAHVYEPLVSREEVCRGVAEDLKEHLLHGSLKSFVLNLIQGASSSDVAELRKAIETLEQSQ